VLLTVAAARAVQLAAQGLLVPPARRATKADVLAAITRMGVLQIDTIHVVARSPYLVLFSRLGAYRPAWLEGLLEEGALFECWAHEACFAPMSSFPELRRHQLERTGHWSSRHAGRTKASHANEMTALLERIREGGAVKASDFADARGKGASSGFWEWKAEKRWLEAWFALGELMVLRRDRFHRVYDVTRRVLERAGVAWEEVALPTREEARKRLTVDAVRALGVVRARHVNDYYRVPGRATDEELGALVEEGALRRLKVRGRDETFYAHPDLWGEIERASRGDLKATHTTLLSPFDPVVWDRERAREMFDFDYRLECYVPAEKREFGYFVLPILSRGRLVGRLDAKAHREDGVFEVKKVFFEERTEATGRLAKDVAGAIQECANWHGTERVKLVASEPRGLAKALRAALKGI
jgi:uncharacterized protein